MDEAIERAHAQQLREAARWLGLGVSVAPIADIADRSGVLTALMAPSTGTLSAMSRPLALIVLFACLGAGAAWLLPRHAGRGRVWFFAACAIPVAAWAVAMGAGWISAIGVLALGYGALRLRGLGPYARI